MPKVIRAADCERMAHFRVDGGAADEVARARNEAERVLEEANQAAALLRAKAESETRAVAAQTTERLAVEQQQIAALRSLLVKSIEEFRHARQQWQSHWERQAVRLGTAVARRVLRRELRADPDVALPLVREALELAAGSTRLRLVMNPDDVESLGGELRKLLAECAGAAELVADPAISQGGCRLETENGLIDQQFETQLARIAEELN